MTNYNRKARVPDVELYYVNKNSQILENNYDMWHDEMNQMKTQELKNARTHFSLRISELQKILDLINAEIAIRENKRKFKVPTSRRYGQSTMIRGMRGMARKRYSQIMTGHKGT